MKIKHYLLTIVTLLLLGACHGGVNEKIGNETKQAIKEKDNGKGENNMYEYDIYDFADIKKAPEAAMKHPLSNVIKILFDAGSIAAENTIAIDILKNEVFINPKIGSRGLRFSDGSVEINDTEKVIKILEKYDVQNWKNDYTFENPEFYQDGYGWVLRLQFEDGTVEIYGGEGSRKSEIIPENFDEFFAELSEFVKERIE